MLRSAACTHGVDGRSLFCSRALTDASAVAVVVFAKRCAAEAVSRAADVGYARDLDDRLPIAADEVARASARLPLARAGRDDCGILKPPLPKVPRTRAAVVECACALRPRSQYLFRRRPRL